MNLLTLYWNNFVLLVACYWLLVARTGKKRVSSNQASPMATPWQASNEYRATSIEHG